MIAAEVLAARYGRLETPEDQLPDGYAVTREARQHADDGLGLTFWIRREDASADKER